MAIGIKPTSGRVAIFGSGKSEIIDYDDSFDKLTKDRKFPDIIDKEKERINFVSFQLYIGLHEKILHANVVANNNDLSALFIFLGFHLPGAWQGFKSWGLLF